MVLEGGGGVGQDSIDCFYEERIIRTKVRSKNFGIYI